MSTSKAPRTLRVKAWCHHWLIRLFGNCIGSSYSPPSPSPSLHSPDTQSHLYPDRPIRPLPKRRLRSRLSSDVAESILYPAAPVASTPLFYFPYTPTDRGEEEFANGGLGRQQLHHHEHHCDHDHDHDGHNHEEELDSDKEEDGAGIIRRYQGQQDALASATSHTYGSLSQLKLEPSAMLAKPPPPRSNASSADGYDSFENTNNKKKRKIPTPGNMSNHHSYGLSADMANMGISAAQDNGPSSPDELSTGAGQYYGSGYSASSAGGSGNGVSGAGRGRYGRTNARSVSGRSPLGVSTNGTNAWANGQTGRSRRDWVTAGGLSSNKDDLTHPNIDQGIISAAIASAAENGSSTPSTNGKENVSLLQQQSSKKSTPTKTQFTFTCESDSAKSMAWQGQNAPLIATHYQNVNSSPSPATPGRSHLPPGARGVATQGTQTSPSMAGPRGQSNHGLPTSQHALAGTQQPSQQQFGNNQQAPPQGKKSRPRRTGKEYALAARQRRLQQEYNNYHHPPSGEDVWICEFCEYESIFGSPPEALMRQYEIKDRRERRRLAEKRRLLEKAKMKGRKGKKGSKAAAKNAGTNNLSQQQSQHQQQQKYDQQPTDQLPMQHQGTQSEDYYDDGFDDEPLSVTSPGASMYSPPIPGQQPKPLQNHSGGVNGGMKGSVGGTGGMRRET
ncbi:MAG: hypothetical protein M1827_004785 [Pycnora praestabilis]|nr:MAG: hypothetical protein M1827_004785 [Pycnora praestabilis]